jgi:hypothetical protein
MVNHRRQRLLSALEPSGLSGQALDERLKSWGDEVCLGHCQAVRNHRQTMPDGPRKTDATEAARGFDVVRQGTCLLPGVRAPARTAAYRLMRRQRALKQRGSQRRQPLRAALPLALPAFHPRIHALTQPTAWRFLQGHPTPASLVRPGPRRFLAQGQPRWRCGQWPREPVQPIYALAPARRGRKAPYWSHALERQALAQAWADALATPPLWLAQALACRAPRRDCQPLLPLPRIGHPPAAALLPAIGAVRADSNGTQVGTLAGLDVRRCARGPSRHKLPQRSHVGRASRRPWLAPSALRLGAPEPQGNNYDPRRHDPSPGQGAGQRALLAVCDTTIRMI